MITDDGLVLITEGLLLDQIWLYHRESEMLSALNSDKIFYPTSHALFYMFQKCGFRLTEAATYALPFGNARTIHFNCWCFQREDGVEADDYLLQRSLEAGKVATRFITQHDTSYAALTSNILQKKGLSPPA